MSTQPHETTTEQLHVYLNELRDRLPIWKLRIDMSQRHHDHLQDLICETIEELNKRESCPHEDFTENLEGRKCRECGLETK
jgi:hypothetical protein